MNIVYLIVVFTTIRNGAVMQPVIKFNSIKTCNRAAKDFFNENIDLHKLGISVSISCYKK